MIGRINRTLSRVLFCSVLVFLILLVIGPVAQVFAKPSSLSNTFGGKKVRKNGMSKVHGVDAYATTPDSFTVIGQATAAPVGITDWVSDPFFEAGAEKTCNITCSYYAYTSWDDVFGNGDQINRTDLVLGPNLTYRYKVFDLSANVFESQFCSGNGCFVLHDVNLGLVAVDYAAAGAEGRNGANYGPVDDSYFQWKNQPGNWAYACYNQVLGNPGISACGSTYNWTIDAH